MTTMRWSGEERDYWDAVLVCGDPESSEDEVIEATLLIQEVLHLAQDALTRPEQTVSSSGAATPKALPRPGDVVDIARATELFADRWILQPVDPDRTSPISAHRDYRWRDGALEFNSSYPPQWKKSGGEISDVPQWRVMCREADPIPEVTPQVVGERTSRTTVKTA